MWGSVSTAPPDYFIVLPDAKHGNGLRSTGRQCGIAEIQCAPDQYVVHNQAQLMSSALRQQERAVSELMPEVSVLDRFLVRRGDQVRTGDCLEQ